MTEYLHWPGDETATIQEVKEWAAKNVGKGVICPCCGRIGKVYRRTIHHSMAMWLLLLVRLHREGKEWVTVREIDDLRARLRLAGDFKGGDYAKLALWGLIFRQENTDEKKRTSGTWRATMKGHQFAAGQIALPRRCLTLMNARIRYEGENRTIRECLGEGFDYREVMGGAQ